MTERPELPDAVLVDDGQDHSWAAWAVAGIVLSIVVGVILGLTL